MTVQTLVMQRWQDATGTMLGQIRILFLGVVLLWPLFGLWEVTTTAEGPTAVLAVATTIVLAAWLYIGYYRLRFPAWSWIFEGFCVAVVAGASDYHTTIGICFMWVMFRALYGGLREKFLGAAVIVAIMLAGILVFDARPANIVPLLCIALICLGISHFLAQGSGARDRAAARERVMALAGAGLVASTTRAEAMDVTLGAALSLDRVAGAALIFTVSGPVLHVVAVAGQVGAEAQGRVTELAELPAEARDALRPEGSAVLGGHVAEATAHALRLTAHAVLILAPLTVEGHVFGSLVLALDRRPADNLSTALTTLAGEAALALDQLLTRTRLGIVVEYSTDALMLAGEAGFIRYVNPAAEAMLNRPSAELLGRNLWLLLHPEDLNAVVDPMPDQPGRTARLCRIRGGDDTEWIPVEAIVEYVSEHDGSRSVILNVRDVSERQRLELELRHAQKLESVGRLAAGIAHEINTPIQFVGDNVRFLAGAFADLGRLFPAHRHLVTAVRAGDDLTAALRELEAAGSGVDVDFILAEAPVAISQSLEGIDQVANIVRAMKAFGHPGSADKGLADLNRAIENTLVVASNEIKYVADVVTDLADLPLVSCHIGDLNQVVLNLVVNAAHAIGSAGRGRGTIRVSTRLDDADVVIEVADTGTGVPAEIADKLFDPFFTTKDVGSGTGQGLALARTLVADRHNGTISFTSEPGAGTVFIVRLPVVSAGQDLASASESSTAIS